MNKFLLTTAIASSALFAGNAIAQTTVSGDLVVSLKNISSKKANDGISSMSGMGREWQINIQNKGKLNNDMGYAAGFSLEHDGSQTGVNGLDENIYIDFISGNTTFTIGTDHIQNSDRTLGNFVGLIAEDLTNTAGGSITSDIFRSDVGADPAQAYGIGIIQTIPGMATLSAWYSPIGLKNQSAGATAFVGNDDMALDSTSESSYEIGFTGGFGIKGLNTHAFINKQDLVDGATGRNIEGYNYGLSYNFGQVTAGYNYKKHRNQTAAGATAATDAGDVKQHEYGIAYALTPNLTLGANYTKAEPEATTTKADAKSKSIAVGYNLGAIALTAQAAKVENYTGLNGVDADVLFLRASTKF